MRHAVILAGGAGTRLWPLSRANRPKQLIPFMPIDGRRGSLLELALNRLDGFLPPERIHICTREDFRAPIRTMLPHLKDANFIGEPTPRDTTAAIALSAALLRRADPKAIMAVLTSDQRISPTETFQERLDLAFRIVEKDAQQMATFFIEPTEPTANFGYIEREAPIPETQNLAWRIASFHEKPDRARAQAYIESGSFGWNAGMFVWSAETFLDCVRRYRPTLHEGIERIISAWDTPYRDTVLAETYADLPRISVDYAILEKAAREQQRMRSRNDASNGVKLCTIKLDVDWLDVGSWTSYEQTMSADDKNNRSLGRTSVLECKDVTVFNDDDEHYVAVLGCEDLIVVRCGDATLIMSRDKANDLKRLYGTLPEHLK